MAACGPHSPLAVPAAGWLVHDHPEITPPSNFHQLRDTTNKQSMTPLSLSKAGGTITAGEPSQTLTAGNTI